MRQGFEPLRISAALIFLALSGCGPLFPECRICLESAPEQVVAKADQKRIWLFVDAELPASADHVYFRERCGKDCTRWLRFTAPDADARRFVEQALKQRPRKGVDPMLRSHSGKAGPGYDWWPAQFPAGFEGGEIDMGGKFGAVVIAPVAGKATVWLYEFDM